MDFRIKSNSKLEVYLQFSCLELCWPDDGGFNSKPNCVIKSLVIEGSKDIFTSDFELSLTGCPWFFIFVSSIPFASPERHSRFFGSFDLDLFVSRLGVVEKSSLDLNIVVCSAFRKDGIVEEKVDDDDDDVNALSRNDDEASRAEAAVEEEAEDVINCDFFAKYEPICMSSTSDSSLMVNLPILFLKFIW